MNVISFGQVLYPLQCLHQMFLVFTCWRICYIVDCGRQCYGLQEKSVCIVLCFSLEYRSHSPAVQCQPWTLGPLATTHATNTNISRCISSSLHTAQALHHKEQTHWMNAWLWPNHDLSQRILLWAGSVSYFIIVSGAGI